MMSWVLEVFLYHRDVRREINLQKAALLKIIWQGLPVRIVMRVQDS
jgi:hypothetical protein